MTEGLYNDQDEWPTSRLIRAAVRQAQWLTEMIEELAERLVQQEIISLEERALRMAREAERYEDQQDAPDPYE
jgi:histone H3/H4